MVMRQRMRIVVSAAVLMAFGWALFGPARQAEASPVGGYVAPLPLPLTVLQPFDLPAQPWLPGNRGVDLAATTGEPVVAAADGVVLYAGLLAGRGVVSISHGDLRMTYEPVDPLVARGAPVRRGQLVARVSAVADGCGPPGGCLHWGAIRGGAYVNPLGLLAVPRVRLLPIWTDGLPRSVPMGLPAANAAASSATAAASSSATTRPADDGGGTTAVAAGAAAGSVGLAAAIAVRRRGRSTATGKLPAL